MSSIVSGDPLASFHPARRDRRKPDLKPGEAIATAIRRSFPLPSTGAFTDLLDAIDQSVG